jgi:hypothetical protein
MQQITCKRLCLSSKLGVVGAFLLVLTVAASPVGATSIDVPALERELIFRHALDDAATNTFRAIIQDIGQKSRYRGCIRFNEPATANCLAVLFVRPHVLPEPVCASLGSDTLLCDTSFLNGYLDTLGVAGLNDPRGRTMLYAAFQRWVLAHEIAHADLRQQPSQFIGDAIPVTQDLAVKIQHIEVEADQRAEQLGAVGNVEDYQSMLIEVFNAAFQKKYHYLVAGPYQLKYDRDLGLVYSYALSASHPDMTLRTAGLLVDSPMISPPVSQEAFCFLRMNGAPEIASETGLLGLPPSASKSYESFRKRTRECTAMQMQFSRHH